MATGNIYYLREGNLLGGVDYRFQAEDELSWWGELVFTEYCKVDEMAGYTLELEDGRRGNCRLRKMVNKAVHGMPSRHYYQFHGTGLLT